MLLLSETGLRSAKLLVGPGRKASARVGQGHLCFEKPIRLELGNCFHQLA